MEKNQKNIDLIVFCVCEVLGIKKSNMIDVDLLDKILNMRLLGVLNICADEFIFSADMRKVINSLINLNRVRNQALIDKTIVLDQTLLLNNIPRMWIKGIRDCLDDEKWIENRKMVDVDLLTRKKDKEEIIRSLQVQGFKRGVYGRSGNYVEPTMEQFIKIEQNHYEYIPFCTEVRVFLEELECVDEKLLNRFRVYKDKYGYFTDYTLDVHHGLASEFNLDDRLENIRLPIMSSVDDVWYGIHKCYYELLLGKSIDMQLLIFTIIKIENLEYVYNYMAEHYPKYININAFRFFNTVLQKDVQSLKKILEIVKNRNNSRGIL